MSGKPDISVIVPVNARHDETGTLAREYLDALRATERSFEIVFVLDGQHAVLRGNLTELARKDMRLRIVQLARSFGESTALSAGLEHTSGDIIVTLPAYHQVKAGEIGKLVTELEHSDLVVGARWPRAANSGFEVLRRKVFHWMVNRVTGSAFDDLGCGARAMRREVAEEVPVYGDQHRFIALLAIRRGFNVRQITLLQSERDRYDKHYSASVYVQRLLDILTILFLVRFTRKPLRFFGMIGSVTFLVGALFLAYVSVERLLGHVPLADRPALLLSSLLMVLGLQSFAIGLLGELIIFTHARESKEYTIEKIVN